MEKAKFIGEGVCVWILQTNEKQCNEHIDYEELCLKKKNNRSQ